MSKSIAIKLRIRTWSEFRVANCTLLNAIPLWKAHKKEYHTFNDNFRIPFPFSIFQQHSWRASRKFSQSGRTLRGCCGGGRKKYIRKRFVYKFTTRYLSSILWLFWVVVTDARLVAALAGWLASGRDCAVVMGGQPKNIRKWILIFSALHKQAAHTTRGARIQ